ncbi:DUF883 domain-containing protein [Maritimibacter sp. UBA3975]|uniref:glycine zipper domain-containing protein n=1 Tax=Maritimibacter sp. UBA3975 TaxID=1946833 RepID=UPI0025C584A4|nr:DUF883 domain-containing protein [Maritimibacter sp. UBA3975]|tara:strand:- start:9356 stop:9703 length:348 start_codon:yes stop_codon:yes gene_type:complete
MATATPTTTTTAGRNGMDKDVKDLQAQIEQLKGDVSELTTTLRDVGNSTAAEYKTRAKKTAKKARAKGQKAAQDAQDSAAAYYRTAEGQVRENPAAAVGIAAGVGFMVGLFLSRK